MAIKTPAGQGSNLRAATRQLDAHPANAWGIVLRLLLAASAAGIAGYQLLHFLTWAPEQLAMHGVLLDDAYFYSVLARNYQHLGFLTLDGVMPTNGIQPLWMLIQVTLTWLLPKSEPATLLSRSSWLFYVLFTFLTVWYVSRARWSSWISAVSAALLISSGILLNVNFQKMVVRGLETPLMLFLLMLFLHILDGMDDPGTSPEQNLQPWQISMLAALGALVFFARTDLFWLSLVAASWLILRCKEKVRTAVIYAGTSFVLILPYLLSNWITHGHLMPISGRVKVYYLNTFYPSWGAYLSSNEWKGLFFTMRDVFALPNELKLLVLLALALMAAGLVLVFLFKNSARIPASLKILTLAVIAHVAFMQIVYRELRPYSGYYFSVELAWAFLWACSLLNWSFSVFQEAVERLPNPNFLRHALPTLAGLVISVFFVISLGSKYVGLHELKASRYSIERVNLAHDIERLVPAGEQVGAFWPGVFAEFSNRSIIPLDGIIGSEEYFTDYLQKGREMDYLFEHSAEYVVIYLKKLPGGAFSDKAPAVFDWTVLGTRKVWEYRHISKIIAARTWGTDQTGWYLIQLDIPTQAQ